MPVLQKRDGDVVVALVYFRFRKTEAQQNQSRNADQARSPERNERRARIVMDAGISPMGE